MLLRNVSELVRNVAEHVSSEMVPDVGWLVSSETVCKVAGHLVRNVSGSDSSETVRNVSGQVSNVGGFRVRVRNVSGSGPVMVPNVGHHVPLLTDVGGQGTNLMSL